jgi:hypothetical protein
MGNDCLFNAIEAINVLREMDFMDRMDAMDNRKRACPTGEIRGKGVISGFFHRHI